MPFGLCNASSSFQATMNAFFKSELCKFVLVFFDDILIYSRLWEVHLKHIKVVFKILQSEHFFLNTPSVHSSKLRWNFLGHFISNEGVQVNESKIATMKNWPRPDNVTKLRGFLGLTGYYRKFVRNYGTIVNLLTQY
jgi:hypothetical protein